MTDSYLTGSYQSSFGESILYGVHFYIDQISSFLVVDHLERWWTVQENDRLGYDLDGSLYRQHRWTILLQTRSGSRIPTRNRVDPGLQLPRTIALHLLPIRLQVGEQEEG